MWRFSPSQPVKEYHLNTVTYGTASAPYLAVKTLQQHALNNLSTAPRACKIILEDFYVDDLFSGCETDEAAIELQKELTSVLASGGFPIRKWTSNSVQLMNETVDEDRELKVHEFEADGTVKTLGLLWYPQTDQYGFKVSITETSSGAFTKRRLLSELASIFDPLGMLAPVVISAQILMQQLWLLSIGWDDELPSNVIAKWTRIKNELPAVNDVKINRWINLDTSDQFELHGFADASEAAYAAVVYARVTKPNRQSMITVLAAKTRVAPLKQISLPRCRVTGGPNCNN